MLFFAPQCAVEHSALRRYLLLTNGSEFCRIKIERYAVFVGNGLCAVRNVQTGNPLLPYVGWLGSETAGAIRISGITVRKVGNQWNNAMPYLGFSPPPSPDGTVELKEVDSADSPIAYQKTIRAAHNGTAYQYQFSAPLSTFPQPTATDRWTLSFWAKTDGNNTVKLYKRTSNSGAPQSTALIKDDRWHYYAIPLALGSGFDLSDIALYYSVEPQTEVYLNGISLVPGDVPLATESYQNSAALKNKTIDTGTVKFNTAIEYDTDVNRTAYARVKHFINNGEAISYSYDENGNISSIQSPDGSYVTYEYDYLNQLISEHYSTCLPLSGDDGGVVTYNTVSYEYDTRGNLTEKTYSLDDTVVDTVSYGYTDSVWKDRLTSFDGNNIAYDQIGNPLNWTNGATLSWQHGRQLASYSKDGTSINYTYDADGIRTSKTVNGVTTAYTVTDGTLRRMTSGDNTLEFINGTSVIFNGTEYWYIFNAQNDVIGIIDQNGEYVVEYTYDAWGAPLSKSGELADTLGTLNPFRYRGYIYDEETGWYYCQSRYYDPVVGRFINGDGVVSGVGSIHGHNIFAYCFNNPLSYYDQEGQYPSWLKKALNKTKNTPKIKHDVPLYAQRQTDLCWAFCECMVVSYHLGISLNNDDATEWAVNIAKSKYGDDWNQSGTPATRGKDIQVNSIYGLYAALEDGPLYASYQGINRKGEESGHLVVVTGVDISKNIVYSNNPHGVRGEQTFQEFQAQYYHGPATQPLIALYKGLKN